MNKEYKLLQSFNLEDIESQLNEYASYGWELNGSIDMQVINGKPVYTQMLVRQKRDINESNPDNGKQLLHG